MELSVMRAIKKRLREYPRLLCAYAELLLFIRSLKTPAWEVRCVNGQFVCANGHVQQSFDTVDGRHACMICFADDVPHVGAEAWLAPGLERSGAHRWLSGPIEGH